MARLEIIPASYLRPDDVLIHDSKPLVVDYVEVKGQITGGGCDVRVTCGRRRIVFGAGTTVHAASGGAA